MAARRALSSTTTAVAKRHRPFMKLGELRPARQNDVWVAPNAIVVGKVMMSVNSSVWYGAVVRGDLNKVSIGPFSNVQEKAVIQTVESLETGFPSEVKLGHKVSVGPGCVLRSCTVEDNVQIGAGTILEEGSLVESNTILEPGTYVGPGGRIPTGEMWAGNPAQFVKKLDSDAIARIGKDAVETSHLALELKYEYIPLPDDP